MRLTRTGNEVKSAEQAGSYSMRRLTHTVAPVPLLIIAALVAGAAAKSASASLDTGESREAESVATVAIYQPPEKWTYSFSWWPFLRVGTAEITAVERVRATESPAGTVPARQQREIAVSIEGKTSRLLDAIWRYRIDAEAVVPLEPLRPGTLEMHEIIKKKPKHTRISYDDGEFLTWRDRNGSIKETRIVAPGALDIVSTLYQLLNEDLDIGDRYVFETIAGRSRYDVRFEVLKNGRIKVASEKIDAIKLKVTGADLTDPEDTRKHRKTMIWVSAERPRRLLQVVTGLWIGTVKVRLRAVEPLDANEGAASAVAE